VENYMELTFKGVSINEGFARVCAAAFASQLDPTIEDISDIKTAVSEAVTNAIVHAYRDTVGDISMKCSLSGNQVTIEVEDFGMGIENVDEALQPFFTTADSDERSGMGFTVMQTFMDSLTVNSVPGRGTRVIMEKRFHNPKR
jgi:stage II sporulation protein AB (anti-sigma F factor)